MGFSGNVEPSYIIPTCIGINDAVGSGGAARRGSALEDLDFAIGNEARPSRDSSALRARTLLLRWRCCAHAARGVPARGRGCSAPCLLQR
jgi:hypothetical protein